MYLDMVITCFAASTQCFQIFYMWLFQRWCARFTEVVHVSQKLCTFHKPPNNVCVQLYTHRAHSNQPKHWGDQTCSPVSCIAGDTSGEWPQKCLNNNSGLWRHASASIMIALEELMWPEQAQRRKGQKCRQHTITSINAACDITSQVTDYVRICWISL
jgi:hypothetical protein